MSSKKAIVDVDELELFVEDTPSAEADLDFLVSASDAPEDTFFGIDLAPTATGSAVSDDDVSDLICDIDDDVQYLTWLLYGKNGTGKTSVLATAEGMLVAAAEDGTLSIRDKAKGKAKKMRIDTWDKLEKLYWKLYNGRRVMSSDGTRVEGIEINVKGGKFVVRYLAIDTVTQLAETCMRNVVLKGAETDKSRDIIKRTMRDWGDMSEKLKYWLQQFKELPIQKIWVFQESSNSEDTDSDEFAIYPAINKSLRSYAMSQADIIARTFIARQEDGSVQFRLSAKPNANYVTKDRTNMLTGAIPNPNLDKIHKHIFG